MKREIVMAKVSSVENKLCMALYEDQTCVELRMAHDFIPFDAQMASNEKSQAICEDEVIPCIGDIYIGRVEKVIPSINAAFIEIAKGVSCYYPLKEVGTAIFTKKMSQKTICEGEELLVQVLKEAAKTKQATVTSNISFKGTYTVLTSGNKTLGVSAKIQNEKRIQLQEELKPFVNQEYGLIARTNAATVDSQVVMNEVARLQDEFFTLKEKASTRAAFTRMKKVSHSYLSFIEDIYGQKIDRILVEDATLFDEISCFLKGKYGENSHCELKYYDDVNFPLEKLYSLETRIAEGLHKKVWMKSGAYLIIEVTEALTVIDVNSGKAVHKKNAEESYLTINKEAAKEVAKQIRLRNISGIILVDFINLKQEEATEEVLAVLEKEVRRDRVATQVVGMTKLQLLEMTRKKTHKTLWESVSQSKGL